MNLEKIKITETAKTGRPSEKDLQSRAKNIKDQRPADYQKIIEDLEDMAAGNYGNGLRDEYYSGWEDEDFKKLLEMIRPSIEREEIDLEGTEKSKLVSDTAEIDAIRKRIEEGGTAEIRKRRLAFQRRKGRMR